MVKIKAERIKEMYDFHTAYNKDISNLKPADWAFVFGRANPLISFKVGQLWENKLIKDIMISGGMGKDSYPLTEFGIYEAHFQACILNTLYNIPLRKIHCEIDAKNGGDNCRNGIDLIVEEELNHDHLILVSHPTSLRRLSETFQTERVKKGFESGLQFVATDYNFNPLNPDDQKEAVGELLRLADWPDKGWLRPQENLPENLVEYARDLDSAWKA